jgi:hypothetical protein
MTMPGAIVVGVVGFAALLAGIVAPPAPARAQDTGFLPRAPDAAYLQLGDLPPGFEEFTLPVLPALSYTRLQNVAIGETVYRRATRTGGMLVWNVAFRTREPATADQLGRWAAGFFGWLAANVRETEYTEHTVLDTPAIGEEAVLVSFHHAARDYPIAGDGALLAFRRGEVVVLLLVENLDGRALDDARDYARLLDARLQREGASAGR